MANTFKFGNGKWYGKKGTIMAYNDENSNIKPLAFDFTRTSTATYVGSDGLIKTAGDGEPRVDYLDNTDGHLLLEPSATQLIQYSEDFSNAAWTKLNVTVASNSSISPDGTQNANSITGNGTSGSHYILDSFSVTTGEDYTVSIFAKEGTNSFIQLNLGATPFLSTNYCNFDLKNGIIGTYGNTSSNRFIENYGNGWYRVGFTATASSSGSANFFPTLITSSTSSFLESNTLDTSVNVWGAMIEQNSYSTSYIKSEGASVTRTAESCKNAGNSAVFNDSEGVLYFEGSALANDDITRAISINDKSTDNFVQFSFRPTSNSIRYRLESENVVQFTDEELVTDTTIFNKFALVYDSNNFSFWFNGGREFLRTGDESTPINLSNLDFENGEGSNPFYGKVKEIKVYTTALTDAELKTLTT